MTLKNARRRFAEMGYELEPNSVQGGSLKGVAPYKYRARKIGGFKWLRGSCLETLLIAASLRP